MSNAGGARDSVSPEADALALTLSGLLSSTAVCERTTEYLRWTIPVHIGGRVFDFQVDAAGTVSISGTAMPTALALACARAIAADKDT